MFEEVDSSNRRWTVAPFHNFYGITWVGFHLNTGKHLRGFILKPIERA